jgi:hypothetical protein
MSFVQRTAFALCIPITVIGGMVLNPAQAGVVVPKLPIANAADFTPRVVNNAEYDEAGVKEFQQIGATMYVGGEFRTVLSAAGTTTYRRYSLFSFAATTGVVSSWAPTLNGNIYALQPSADGRFLYIGGGFTTFNGATARNLVKYDLVNNRVDITFRPNVGRVTDLALVGSRLFVSGIITGGIQALDPTSGAKTDYFDKSQAAGGQVGYVTRIYRFAVNPAQSKIVVIGSFTTIGGQPRQQVAMINLGASAAAVSAWYSPRWDETCVTSLSWYTRDVDFAPDGTNFVVATSGAGFPGTPKLCDTVSRWETVDLAGRQPTWINYSGGDTFHSVTATNLAIFASGHFRWLDNPLGRDTKGPGAVDRRGIGAMDTVTGKALDWNPGKGIEGGLGGYDLFFNSQGLWVGSHERLLANEVHEGLGLLPF